MKMHFISNSIDRGPEMPHWLTYKSDFKKCLSTWR